jgi:dienelactone hydrolase
MAMRLRRRERTTGALLVVGLVLSLLGWSAVGRATEGVTVRQDAARDVPVTVLVPDGADGAPGVVVAHGFAGSRELMLGWGLALARGGYVVVLPDLSGHGDNPAPLPGQDDPDALARDVRVAADLLARQPEVDPARLAVLGHSMGSGAVLGAALASPSRFRAVVAVSPTDAAVTPESPPDLLLMAGALEPRFVANATDLLERAGGPRGEAGDGDARALVVVPRVEHVSILFSDTAHTASIDWLDASLGNEPVERAPVRAILAWLAVLVGVVAVWQVVAGLLVTPARAGQPPRRPLLGLAVGTVAATATLIVLGRVVELGAVAGMLVGPALALWFAITGAVWLRSGVRPRPPDARDIGWGLLALGALVVAFGVLGARVWLPWWLPRTRALYVVPFALLVLPFTLAWATAADRRRGGRAVAWWAGASLVFTAMAAVTGLTVPGLFFLLLLLPLLPAVLGLIGAVAAPLGRPWSAGLAGAAFLAWTMAALFPLA